MQWLYRLKKYFEYQWYAQTKYYIHSPFVYNFCIQVLGNKDFTSIQNIEKLRMELRNAETEIHIQDFGTGKERNQQLNTLENKVAVRSRYGRVLYSLVKYYRPQQILEFGTSIGLSSCYMAAGNNLASIITLEGSPELARQAQNNFDRLSFSNIQVMVGEFSQILPTILQELEKLDLVYFDGNHTCEATLQYFHRCLGKVHDDSIFIFDDIYWNSEMTAAWKEIKRHPKIRLTIDVFQFGICFFKPDKLAKEDFVLRY